MPPYQNNFDPDTKTQLFPTTTQKPSQFRSLHWNQVKINLPRWHQLTFHHPHKNQVNVDAHTELSHFRPAHKN